MDIKSLGVPLTAEKISLVEAQLGFPLPLDYREFLLKNNGCGLAPVAGGDVIVFVGSPRNEDSPVLEKFYPLVDAVDGRERGTVMGVRHALMGEQEIGLPDFLLPIGSSNPSQVLLSLHPSLFGRVYIASIITISDIGAYATGDIAKSYPPNTKVPTVIEYLEGRKVNKWADTFTGFLKILRSKSNKPIF